ncbi:acyltransferase family protein [Actibacterium ureilyticum]|uniref:acyltransferase family protein n=1 Tax=Actibacterium ureilyticum TaxID=1590614 RepID=UPI001140A737|nr:acyltransferase family protein [Actibacterium ureilyticum]
MTQDLNPLPGRSALPGLALVKGYNPTVDYMRFLAALVIVLFHAHAPGGQAGETAVGYFTLVMVWFALHGASRHTGPLGPVLRSRCIKLLYPFVVWNLIYLSAKAAQTMVSGGSFWDEVAKWLPPAGSFGQLWFLPWAAVISAGIFMAAQSIRFEIRTPQAAAIGIGLAALVTLGALRLWTHAELPPFLALSVLYLPSVVVGIVIFALRHAPLALLAAAMGTSLFGLMLQQFGYQGAQQLIFAAPLMALSLFLPTPRFRWTKAAGVMSMDIYLVHLLSIAIMSATVGIPATLSGSILIVLLAFAMALPLQIPILGRWLR